MKVHKKEIFFLLPLFFFYFVFYILLRYLPMDAILSKGLVVGNVLIYSPGNLVGVPALCSFSWLFLALFFLGCPLIFPDYFHLWGMDSSLSCRLFPFLTSWKWLGACDLQIYQEKQQSWKPIKVLANFFNRAIIIFRDISPAGNLLESAWSWKSRRGCSWDYSTGFYENIKRWLRQSQSEVQVFLACINEGGTTLRRPFEDVAFCMEMVKTKLK